MKIRKNTENIENTGNTGNTENSICNPEFELVKQRSDMTDGAKAQRVIRQHFQL